MSDFAFLGVPLSLSRRRARQCRELLRYGSRYQPGMPPDPNTHGPSASDPARERELVERALAGCAAARDELIDQLACLPAMVRAKNRRMGGPLRQAELDDATQNVLLAVWSKLRQFDGRVPLFVWAYGFVVVEILRTVERRARRRERQPEPGLELPSGGAEQRADLERVMMALVRLAEPEQSIVRAKHFEDLTFDAIAARLGLIVNTVKTKYYRSLALLRGELAGVARDLGRTVGGGEA
jgi:RNA polymerase sigma-70 factor (ECF subfamily)